MQKAKMRKMVRMKLSKYKENDVSFSQHGNFRRKNRTELSEEDVVSLLFNIKKLEYCEKQPTKYRNEQKFLLEYHLSGSYNMTIIVLFKKNKIMIVSCWKDMKKFWRQIPKFKI